MLRMITLNRTVRHVRPGWIGCVLSIGETNLLLCTILAGVYNGSGRTRPITMCDVGSMIHSTFRASMVGEILYKVSRDSRPLSYETTLISLGCWPVRYSS